MLNFSTEILKQDLPFQGPHLIAASAGTGKTYNIQTIFARLIMEQKLHVREILVVTFTEAATKELKDRLRKVLVELDEALSMNDKDFRQLADNSRQRLLLQNMSPEKRKEAAIAVKIAIIEFDQAAVSTIHGFCQRSLARYAFESGMRFSMEIGGTAEDGLLRQTQDWWRTHAASYRERFQDDPDFTLTKLQKFVQELSGKANYTLCENDLNENTAQGLLLKTANTLVIDYCNAWNQRLCLSFDDLLIGMCDALRKDSLAPGTPFATSLRNEFKAALIDEFQDTDPRQYEIFRRIFLPTGNAHKPILFFVGDPKQAIYSFRGGDIFTYNTAVKELKEKFGDSRLYELKQNFRSTPKLIEAVNMLFKDRNNAFTFGYDTITYDGTLTASPDTPGLLIDGKPDNTPFHLVNIHFPPPQKSSTAWDCTHTEVVRQIIDILSDATLTIPCKTTDDNGTESFRERRIRPADIAILVRTTENAMAIRSMLARHGVQAVLLRNKSVFTLPVALDLWNVILAVNEPTNLPQIRSALLTIFFEIPHSEILSQNESQKIGDSIALFTQIRECWEKHGFATAFDYILKLTNLKQRLAARPTGERDITDILQLGALLQKAASEGLQSIQALTDWLTQRINASDSEQGTEEYQQQLETEEDTVKIITMHSSKGLEFPVVFLPDCWKTTVHSSVLSPFHDENGKLFMTIDPHEEASNEQTWEDMRLLYVAMTRAAQRTVVLYPESMKEEGNQLLTLINNARDNISETSTSPFLMVTADHIMEENLPFFSNPDAIPHALIPPPAPPSIHSQQLMGSYSSLIPSHSSQAALHIDDPHDNDSDESIIAANEPPESLHPIFDCFNGGSATGTCWHEILEEIDFTANEQTICEKVKEKLLVHGFITQDEQKAQMRTNAVLDMITRTLSFPLVTPDGKSFSLNEIPMAERFSEWEFDFSSKHAAESTRDIADIIRKHWNGIPEKAPYVNALNNWERQIPKGFFLGFVDLIFRHDGRFYIIDWKSNQLDRSPDSFSVHGVTAEIARNFYFIQYLLYAAVLHVFLKETMGRNYNYERNFGCVFYFFLRGIAANGDAPVAMDRPGEALLDDLATVLGLGDR